MPANWQQPLALVVVVVAAAWLVLRAWRQRRAATTGGCSSGGCGCSARKKSFAPANRPTKQSGVLE